MHRTARGVCGKGQEEGRGSGFENPEGLAAREQPTAARFRPTPTRVGCGLLLAASLSRVCARAVCW